MSNFEVKDFHEQADQSWKKDEYEAKRSELTSLAIQCIKFDYAHIGGYAIVINLIKTEEYTQSYCNSPKTDQLIKLHFDVKYKRRIYTGSTDGEVLVHRRIIQKAAKDKDINGDIFNRELNAGYVFVKTFLPQAVHRVGCYCCYGDGPNLDAKWNELKNGDWEINYYVDFDFRVEDYTHG